MCNRYTPPPSLDIEREWHVGNRNPLRWWDQVQIHESYTMLTINADGHPLMGRMHKNELDPSTKQPLPLEQQDKRSVIPLAPADYDVWLAGTQQDAAQLLRVPEEHLFHAGPA